MKKRITKLLLISLVVVMMTMSIYTNAFAKSNVGPEVSKDLIVELEKGVPEISDENFEKMVNNTAKEVEFMAKNGIITFDDRGMITYVNVDKFEATYGADANTIELRKLFEPTVMTRGHIENFTGCMVGKLAKNFGMNELKNLVTGEIANYFSKGAYQKAVQKLAQRAVDKLGKKAAIKLVNFALPSGWVLNAAKVGLWSIQCTVFYDK